MVEYIDKTLLLSDIDAAMKKSGMGYAIGQTLKRYVKRQPSADVAPVVHGRWETANDGTRFCSNCGWDATYTWDDIDRSFINSADDVPDRITNYCPNCGAKMDLEGADGKT